jgi:hypothetical protein
LFDLFRGRLDSIRVQEPRIPQCDLEIIEAATDERLGANWLDIVFRYPFEELVVEAERLFTRHSEQDRTEGRILIASAQLVMRFTKPQSVAKLAPGRPAFESLLIDFHRRGPEALALEAERLLKLGLGGRRLLGIDFEDRGGIPARLLEPGL